MHIKSTIITEAEEERFKNTVQKGLPKGVGCTELEEFVPIYHYSDVEKIRRLESGYNSFITLGKDRHSSRFSGAGGHGETQCGMIDLVAGRIGSALIKNPKILKAKKGSDPIMVGSNWFADSARVYISQKTKHVDKYLGFANNTHDPADLSAVVIKSDCTRIVGRESVRIYTGSSKTGEGLGDDGELRSNGTPISSPKIELVGGGNDVELQPGVLGNNLVDFLKENNDILTKNLRGILSEILIQLTTAHAQLAVVTLGSGAASASKFAIDNVNSTVSSIMDGINIKINNINYLDEGMISGKKSILSNKVYLT
jgi:hypothetical protein